MFTPPQLKQFKAVLAITAAIFVLQLGMPQVSLAANENYLALSRNEEVVFSQSFLGPELVVPTAEMLLAREEKLFPVFSDEQLPLPAEGPLEPIKEYWLTVTAYTSEKHQTDNSPFTTAWGTPVRDGAIAINFLPKGSMVRFPDVFGDKIFIVEDRMNVRYPYRADIWMAKNEEAIQFGLRYLRMELLEPQVDRDYVLKH